MSEINMVKDVVVGEYGVPIILQLINGAGDAQNLSSYTGLTITARGPHGVGTPLTFTGSFVTDGSDGKVQFLPTVSNYFTFDGDWEGQVKLTKSGVVALTLPFIIEVKRALS